MKQRLSIEKLCNEARIFAGIESSHKEPSLFGVTDGKAVGTYLEHKFQKHLQKKCDYKSSSSAKGIDFPQLDVDIKVTSITQPQSSCPFKSARQKIYGLGYSLLIFVYDKKDDPKTRTSKLTNAADLNFSPGAQKYLLAVAKTGKSIQMLQKD